MIGRNVADARGLGVRNRYVLVIMVRSAGTSRALALSAAYHPAAAVGLPTGAVRLVDGRGCPQAGPDDCRAVALGRTLGGMREMITVREAGHELLIQVCRRPGLRGGGAGGRGSRRRAQRRRSPCPPGGCTPSCGPPGPTTSTEIGGPLDPPMWPMSDPEPEEDPHHEERLRFGWRDDWPDGGGDPGELVPFPRGGDLDDPWWPASRYTPPPRPRNHGQAWEPDDDAVLRDAWLATDADAVRGEVLRELADRLGRTVGGVMQRLYRVGCDPARPGVVAMVPADQVATPEEPLIST